jgi:serine/threonine-protein kinase HipA
MTGSRHPQEAKIPPGPDRKLFVHVDWQGAPRLAGVLHAHVEGEREWAEFEPDARWLARPEAAACAPLLGIFPGKQSTGASMPLFGAIGDSAPDRWGRTLLRRRERREARELGRTPRELREVDFLLGVDDEIRVGALRFREKPRGPFLGDKGAMRLPGVRSLPRLLGAVRAHEEARETRAQSELLLVSGQLLGGSRPKASLRADDGRLLVAKFPSRGDAHDMQRWEALTLGLARDCGIAVPDFAIARVDGESVLLLDRFDRDAAGRRIPVISAFGLLAAQDNEAGSHLALARAIRKIGGRPHEDTVALWRRALFAVLVSDKDNHLRNHGLLWHATGWRLCPAYDLNPEAEPRKPRELLLSIDGIDNSASFRIAMDAAADFGVSRDEARDEARRMGRVVATWRDRAKKLRLPKREIDTLRGAFEHDALEAVLRLR